MKFIWWKQCVSRFIQLHVMILYQGRFVSSLAKVTPEDSSASNAQPFPLDDHSHIYRTCNICMISLWILISAFEELMETRDRSEWGWILIWETDIFLRTILWINQILEINRIWYSLRKSLYIIPSFFVYHGNSCVWSCPSLSPICPSKEPG